MANNNKMKGLLKGLRYISQIFDQDGKEPEMEIGYPTDVKHVAHIGWDGPSVNNPSWMNEFKGPTGSSSAPLSSNMVTKGEPSVKWVSEEQGRRSTGSATTDSPKMATSATSGRNLPELPKSSRRHSSTGASASGESPTKTKSDKQKQTRRSSRGAAKDQADGAPKPTRHHHKDPGQEGESPSNLPDIPKKTRRKKSKDSGGSTSKTSRSRAQASALDGGSVTNRDHSHSSCAEETELT